ncbi:uncharacterized protein LOC133718080 [Rosa rugosa]|uniref:uncharacterized protein LOC133718080 n=1 Tax=Rosa rugosa TaxID=74645 RepID=UPI002B40850A|nr:uncharacterized protein LOC133718080 [Rosa rugosa]
MHSQMSRYFNLLDFHLKEAGVSLSEGLAHNEESTNKICKRIHRAPLKNPKCEACSIDVNGDGSFGPNKIARMYAAVHKPGKLSQPQDALVIKLPDGIVRGMNPKAEDMGSAVAACHWGMSSGLSQLGSEVNFCFLDSLNGPNDDTKRYGNGDGREDGGQINLNFGPSATARLMDFVPAIKLENNLAFIDSVCHYLAQHASADKQEEYLKIINGKKSEEVDNFDSLQIWNMLTLEHKIIKALEDNGLLITPMRFHSPPPLLPSPPQGWTADQASRSASKPRPCCFPSIETVNESVSENRIVPESEDHSGLWKRKALAILGVPSEQKKSRNAGGLHIDDDATAQAPNKPPMKGKELVSSASA